MKTVGSILNEAIDGGTKLIKEIAPHLIVGIRAAYEELSIPFGELLLDHRATDREWILSYLDQLIDRKVDPNVALDYLQTCEVPRMSLNFTALTQILGSQSDLIKPILNEGAALLKTALAADIAEMGELRAVDPDEDDDSKA